MTVDPHSLDETIREAVEEHGAALDSPIPDFGSILAGRQQRSRRLLAAATVAIALAGIGGIVLATTRTQDPSNAVSATLDEAVTGDATIEPTDTTGTTTSTMLLPTSPSVTSAPAVTPTEYFCTNPLGEDRLGRSLFGECEPAPSRSDGDYACTDRIGTDDTGRVRFSTCVPVGQLGPLPSDDGDAPYDDPDDFPVRATPYTVQPGDYGIKIADEFCVSLVDLEAANDWSDSSREFPVPGSEILTPNGFGEPSCDVGSYVITPDDITRLAVADKFCISVQALDTANLRTEGYSSFFPGLVIVIPPSADEAC